MIDFTTQLIDNTFISKVDAPVGTYRQSDLTESQFNEASIGVWMLCDGRSCIGTEYERVTGNSNVPDATSEGVFFRQAKPGRELGSYQADEIKSHTHSYETSRALDGGGVSSAYIGYGQNSSVSNQTGKIYATGGVETRPKNIAVNFFIKVDY